MNKLLIFFRWILAKRSRIILAVLFVILIVVFFVTRGKDSEEVQVQTTIVERGTIVSSVTASGQILTSNITHIKSQASGVVKKVYVSDGDYVYPGQTIAEIELDSDGKQNHAAAYASYVSAVNSLENAENNYRSAKATLDKVYDEIQGHDDDETLEMKATRTTTEVAHDNAWNGVENAKASLTNAWLAYSQARAVITAPSEGTINAITIAEGLTLGATEGANGGRTNQRVASIYTEDTPLSSFNVSEIDVSRIRQGQKATITLDAITDKTFTGKVVSVDKLGTTTSGVTTYPVIIQFDNTSSEILPNMATSANIIIETKSDVLLVPSSAVKGEVGQYYVTVSKDGQEENISVTLGITSDTQVEVVTGLDEGDVVVTATVSNQNQEGQFGSSPFGGFGGARIIR